MKGRPPPQYTVLLVFLWFFLMMAELCYRRWVFVLMIQTDVNTLYVCMVKIRNHKEYRVGGKNESRISNQRLDHSTVPAGKYTHQHGTKNTLSSCAGHTLILLPTSILSLWSWSWKPSVSLLPFTVPLAVCSIHLINYTNHMHNF